MRALLGAFQVLAGPDTCRASPSTAPETRQLPYCSPNLLLFGLEQGPPFPGIFLPHLSLPGSDQCKNTQWHSIFSGIFRYEPFPAKQRGIAPSLWQLLAPFLVPSANIDPDVAQTSCPVCKSQSGVTSTGHCLQPVSWCPCINGGVT